MRNVLIGLLLLLSQAATTTWAYDWTCNLHCFNGGECSHGSGSFGSYAGGDDVEKPWEQYAHKNNGMFCACPVGYTGLQCEIKVKVCGADGQDQHTCFNGADCQKERSGKGVIYYRCECDAEESVMTNKYAKEYCEHIATVFCNKHGNSAGDADYPKGSYCTNGGKCMAKANSETKHMGCTCPSGWEGDHCEKATFSSLSMADLVVQATKKKSLGWIAAVVIAVAFMGTGFLWYRDKQKKKADRKRRIEMENMGSNTGSFRANPLSEVI